MTKHALERRLSCINRQERKSGAEMLRWYTYTSSEFPRSSHKGSNRASCWKTVAPVNGNRFQHASLLHKSILVYACHTIPGRVPPELIHLEKLTFKTCYWSPNKLSPEASTLSFAVRCPAKYNTYINLQGRLLHFSTVTQSTKSLPIDLPLRSPASSLA